LLSNWIGTVIINTVDLQDRISVMSAFIRIAKNLQDLNNFNGIFSICSGLALAPIFRLKDTWGGLDDETKEIFKTLNSYISREKNFRNIRAAIKQVNPPCIPYLGLYLTDLTFIEDGNPKYVTVEGNKLVNFVKCRGVII
jgi:son of sevenless-like protein